MDSLQVLIWATITALATGVGVWPVVKDRGLGIGYAIAAGLMSAASLSLIWEGRDEILLLALGMLTGVAMIVLADKYLPEHEEFSFASLSGRDAKRALILIAIMTVHSFAEGVGLGVSWGRSEDFGVFVNSLIALHNIPEGLAIGLVLIPRGVSRTKAALWAVFSSLPQPLVALPAFWFVLAFEPFLPFGLGLAAGAMIWMSFTHLLTEAREIITPSRAYGSYALTIIAAVGIYLTLNL